MPNRLSRDYIEGVKSFIQVAKEHLRWDNKTRCPCRDCQNTRFNDLLTIESHLIRFGFSRSYQRWIFYGEEPESLPNGQNDESICKTRENSNFLKNGKMVISVKIHNFSRSQMMKRATPLESSREI